MSTELMVGITKPMVGVTEVMVGTTEPMVGMIRKLQVEMAIMYPGKILRALMVMMEEGRIRNLNNKDHVGMLKHLHILRSRYLSS